MEVAAGGGELFAGEVEIGGGWWPTGADGRRAEEAGEAIAVMSQDEKKN